MDITATIATNLDAWMAKTPALNTIKKVAARAGIGFGTVQRARNGDGNTTIQNLAAIAQAFGRRVEDLIRPADYSKEPMVVALPAQEPPALAPLLADIMAVAGSMNERGQAELLGRAKELAFQHPRAKPNRANC